MVNHCETCKHRDVEPYNEPCVSCSFRDYDVPTKWKSPFKPKTNADHVRAMSDEELAELFWAILHERDVLMIEKLSKRGIEVSLIELPARDIATHLEWLKRPYEITTN